MYQSNKKATHILKTCLCDVVYIIMIIVQWWSELNKNEIPGKTFFTPTF